MPGKGRVNFMAVVEVKDLVKDFQVNKKESGFRGALKNLVKVNREKFRAVDHISFDISEGEIVGYIGPNGAGKSTTIKMMSGILQPTSGTVLVRGLSPYENRKKVVQNIGVVFGQRSQLYWDLRLGESFELLRRIYRIPDDTYHKNLSVLDDILGIGSIIDTPVRQLSLGQRMKGDLAASMLHSPPLVFLDEPTIGLDVEVKHAVRKFIRDINEQYKTTIILTTHDLDDIEQLCHRIIIINKGIIVEDGSLSELMDRLAPEKTIVVDLFDEPSKDLSVPCARIVRREGNRVWLQYCKKDTGAGEIISHISQTEHIRDISFEETGIDDVIRRVYADSSR